jgi:hypothetical protein
MGITAGADIRDPTLAEQAHRHIEWALQEMPVLYQVMQRFHSQRPLQGIRLGGCLHVTTETANLARALKVAGAEVVICASNPLSTQDNVVAALVEHHGISVSASPCTESNTGDSCNCGWGTAECILPTVDVWSPLYVSAPDEPHASQVTERVGMPWYLIPGKWPVLTADHPVSGWLPSRAQTRQLCCGLFVPRPS